MSDDLEVQAELQALERMAQGKDTSDNPCADETNVVKLPVRYSEALADRILDELATGKPLRRICNDDDMPTDAAVRGWVREDKEGFAQRFKDAQFLGWQSMADEILELSDGVTLTGDAKADNAAVQQARLSVDSRKWLLSKMLPKVFGDRLTHVGDSEADPIAVVPRSTLGEERELARRVAFILHRADSSDEEVVVTPGVPSRFARAHEDLSDDAGGAEAEPAAAISVSEDKISDDPPQENRTHFTYHPGSSHEQGRPHD